MKTKITLFTLTLLLSINTFAQQLDWAKRIGGTGQDGVEAMTKDAVGNIYIAGGFTGSMDADPGPGTVILTSAGGGTDIFFAKYDAAGNYIWAKALLGFNDISNTDKATDIAVDPDGNVYITGSIDNTVDFDPGTATVSISPVNYSQNYFFAKYDPSGNYVWAKTFGKKYYSTDMVKMALDVSGNIYLSGYLMGTNPPNMTSDFDPSAGVANLTTIGKMDIFLAKYDKAGNYLWAHNFGGANAMAQSFSTTIDSHQNVFIAGIADNFVDFDPTAGTMIANAGGGNAFFAKYDSLGKIQWVKTFEGTGNSIRHLILDSADNIYVSGIYAGVVDFDPSTGTSSLSTIDPSITDNYFAKYDASGSYIFAKRLPNGRGSSVGYEGAGPMLTLEQNQTICIAGPLTGTGDFDPDSGIATLSSYSSAVPGVFYGKYDNQGHYIWANLLTANAALTVAGIESNPIGEIFLSGTFTSTIDFDPSNTTNNLTCVGGYDTYIAAYNSINNTNLIAPSNLTATVFKTDASYVQLTWKDNSNNETGFKIERSTDGINFTYLNATPSTSILDYSITQNTTYYYRVYAYNTSVNSGFSNIVQTFTGSTGVIALSDVTQVEVTPNPSTGLYVVRSSSPFKAIKVINMLGEIVYSNDTEATETTVNILSQLQGMYMLNVVYNNKKQTFKIVKY